MAIIQITDGIKKWQRICVSSVLDVPWTELTLDSGMSGSVHYRIKNGICYVNVDRLRSSTMSEKDQTIVTGLPAPEINAFYSLTSNITSQGGLLVFVGITGRMANHVGVDNAQYFGTFSYPVSES